jgi:KUP system potassium uptake protein
MMGTTQKQNKQFALMLGALGVVFGDIGTSPLYALKVLFGLNGAAISETTVVGLISMLLWTITLVVSLKYITFIMRANNKGEGGSMALIALIRNSKLRKRNLFIALGLIGVTLFFGDSVVTPAISVLSAVEGIEVVAPNLSAYVIPITLLIILGLFSIQRYGTGLIGKLFGPVMIAWFSVIAVGGLKYIIEYPAILRALSPTAAVHYIATYPASSFLAMGAIVLAVTGAEALYTDMGHFGRRPIAKVWLFFVFPSLALCYMGQGALLIQNPSAWENPFFLLFPETTHLAVILLATAATLIASQAVISGAFSLAKQSIQLDFLPRMLVKQTSAISIGQIYIPLVNVLLFIGVASLVLFFGSSERLANAYGVAVSGTLLIDGILFVAAMRGYWNYSATYLGLFSSVFLALDLVLVAANVHKIPHGGWLPLVIAILFIIVIATWVRGQHFSAKERRSLEKPLMPYIKQLQQRKDLVRLPGQAVYIGHNAGFTPAALRTAVEELHELHEKVVIVYVQTSLDAHVPVDERTAFDGLVYADGISQVTITYGFQDSPNIPRTLETIKNTSPELHFDPYKAMYIVSLSRIVIGRRRNMPKWQKELYAFLVRDALSASDYYHLPAKNMIEMRTLINV